MPVPLVELTAAAMTALVLAALPYWSSATTTGEGENAEPSNCGEPLAVDKTSEAGAAPLMVMAALVLVMPVAVNVRVTLPALVMNKPLNVAVPLLAVTVTGVVVAF